MLIFLKKIFCKKRLAGKEEQSVGDFSCILQGILLSDKILDSFDSFCFISACERKRHGGTTGPSIDEKNF